jgi:hypothetical protein
MRLISAVSGVQVPAPPPPILLSPSLRRGEMKKLVTLASVGMFLLSLLGVSLAQEKAPAPAPAAPPAATAPVAPAPAPPAAPKQEVKGAKKAKKQKKAKKGKKGKKGKKAKKAKAEE